MTVAAQPVGFSLLSALAVAKKLKERFPISLDEAIVEAANNAASNDQAFLYFPCHPEFAVEKLVQLLQDPEAFEPAFVTGNKTTKRPIYTSWADALLGRGIDASTGIQFLHDKFLVFNLQHQIIVDFVDRTGRSLLPPLYLKTLEAETGQKLRYRLES